MLADRTLLSLTLATTFVAGGVAGWSAHARRPQPPFLPTRADHVYAAQLAALRDKGYDEGEMREALKLHQAHLDSYRDWWREFQEEHWGSLDAVDKQLDVGLKKLELSFRDRTAAPAPQEPK